MPTWAVMMQSGISHYLNWRAWPWRIASKPMRAMMFRPLRFYIRAKRASLARAVLVVRNADGDVLVQSDRSGHLHLPTIPLNAWQPIPPQVESGARQILGRDLSPEFQTIEGRCGDIIFVYATDPLSSVAVVEEARWLTPESTTTHLSTSDLQCLRSLS